jgi:hypothetical protein
MVREEFRFQSPVFDTTIVSTVTRLTEEYTVPQQLSEHVRPAIAHTSFSAGCDGTQGARHRNQKYLPQLSSGYVRLSYTHPCNLFHVPLVVLNPSRLFAFLWLLLLRTSPCQTTVVESHLIGELWSGCVFLFPPFGDGRRCIKAYFPRGCPLSTTQGARKHLSARLSLKSVGKLKVRLDPFSADQQWREHQHCNGRPRRIESESKAGPAREFIWFTRVVEQITPLLPEVSQLTVRDLTVSDAPPAGASASKV